MSKPSRAEVCRIVAAMADRKAKTVDDLAAQAGIGIDAAYGWMHTMHAERLVRPECAVRRSRTGPQARLWRWNDL